MQQSFLLKVNDKMGFKSVFVCLNSLFMLWFKVFFGFVKFVFIIIIVKKLFG